MPGAILIENAADVQGWNVATARKKVSSSTGPNHVIGERVRALRARTHRTQEELAKDSLLARTDVVKLENGHSKGTGLRMIRRLAKGFHLNLDSFLAYLDGEIDIEEALRLIESKQPTPATTLKSIEPVELAVFILHGRIGEDAAAAARLAARAGEQRTSLEWIQFLREQQKRLAADDLAFVGAPAEGEDAGADIASRIGDEKKPRTKKASKED